MVVHYPDQPTQVPNLFLKSRTRDACYSDKDLLIKSHVNRIFIVKRLAKGVNVRGGSIRLDGNPTNKNLFFNSAVDLKEVKTLDQTTGNRGEPAAFYSHCQKQKLQRTYLDVTKSWLPQHMLHSLSKLKLSEDMLSDMIRLCCQINCK